MKFIKITTVRGEQIRVNIDWIVTYLPYYDNENVTVINLGSKNSNSNSTINYAGPVEDIDAMIKSLGEGE